MVAGRLKVWNDLAGEWEYTPGGDSGGSQPIVWAETTVAWDTPGIVANGVTVYTPSVGDILLPALSGISIAPGSAFNGDTPSLVLATGDPLTETVSSTGATGENQDFVGNGTLMNFVVSFGFPTSSNLVFALTTPLKVFLRKNYTDDPGSTAGEATILLAIKPAS